MNSRDMYNVDKVNAILNDFKEIINGGLADKHFATYAQIAKTKVYGTALTQQEVSVTHKVATAAVIPRLNQSGDIYLPQKILGADAFIFPDYTNGQLHFKKGATVWAYVDSTGWHNGVPGAGSVVTKIEIVYYPTMGYWAFLIDGIEVAYVDGNAATSVFKNGTPPVTAASTGASIDLGQTNRIDFRVSGAVVGYINASGTNDGSP